MLYIYILYNIQIMNMNEICLYKLLMTLNRFFFSILKILYLWFPFHLDQLFSNEDILQGPCVFDLRNKETHFEGTKRSLFSMQWINQYNKSGTGFSLDIINKVLLNLKLPTHYGKHRFQVIQYVFIYFLTLIFNYI